MSLVFSPVTLEEQARYQNLFDKCPGKTSDLSFINIWGYALAYGMEWAFADGLAWLRRTAPVMEYRAPVGPWDSLDWDALLSLRFPDGARFARVPETLARLLSACLPGKTVLEEARGDWEYVYSVPELTDLPGRKYHTKKNHLNRFLAEYSHVYVEMTAENAFEALALQEEWCRWRECGADAVLEAENSCVERVLANWRAFPGIRGGMLRVEGRIAAYTVGEALTPEMLVIHFEKGDPLVRGVYQAVNREFLLNAGAGFIWVNREQDLDDEGLRRAKLSYRPVDFLRKYGVAWKGRAG
jgi:hypothetical protein